MYCHTRAKDSFVDPLPILQLVDNDPDTARTEYSQILGCSQGAEPENALEQEGAVEKFCTRLAAMFPTLFHKLAGRPGKDARGEEGKLDIAFLEDMIQEFDARPVRKPQSKEAKKYIVQQLLARGFKKTEIAGKLQVTRKTVYNILNS